VKLLLDVTARVERDHFWFRGLRRFVRPLLAQVQAERPQMDILDCGCGTGTNLDVLSDYGSACGVDRELIGVQRARAAGRQVGRATVTRLPFSGERFDLVTSFDVLYCLEVPDERAAVTEMFRVLRPGGRVVINVAAMPALSGNHSVLAHEVRRYTAPALRDLLERAGFVVERLTYTNATMLPILVPLRLVQRALGLASEENAGREMEVPPRPLNTVLDWMLTVEAALVKRVDLPCGSSLLAMARKPVVGTS
jgi:ubiquinone/menaquinone biosynthesis C-methylase UbiE